MQRFELGTPYSAIVAAVRDILRQLPLNTSPVYLAVDKTGCGAAVCDLLRPVFPTMCAITITGGQTASVGPGGYSIPKVDLVSTMQVLLQGRRLRVAQSLPAAQLLVQELQNFRVKINMATGNERFEAWRERNHDDLTLSVALAA